MRAVFYILSLIVPVAGIVIGAIYLANPSPQLKRVGKICLALAVVAILLAVGSSALLYLMVLNYGGGFDVTPSATYSKQPITNGYKVTILSVTPTDVYWDDITITLTGWTYIANWHPRTADLDAGYYTSVNLTSSGATALGDIDVYCWVNDISGNGFVSGNDYVTVTTAAGANTFSSTTSYRLILVYEPTGEYMGIGATFTG